MFNKTFFHFFFGFLVIIGIAFAVMVVAGSYSPAAPAVDNIATPQ
ncbi:MAG: hypothetical protein V4474_02675 [Patescibacteria group bacterium]